MRKVFADSCYWIALLNPADQHHHKAIEISKKLGNVVIVTSEMVFIEVLNSLADKGKNIKEAAAKAIDNAKRNPTSRVIPLASVQFNNALINYRKFEDKKWSLVDCSSFNIMANEEIKEALTHDRHFKQAGFEILLSE